MNKSSYTAASTFPIKIFYNKDLVLNISDKNIKPIHIQVNPTNKCPLNCSFCSCKNRDKSIELSLPQLIKATKDFIKLGTKAVTITGGGDPLAYTSLNSYVKFLHDNNIKSGLVTNGILFKKNHIENFKYLTWCRVSLSDEYDLISPKLKKIINETCIDWSFSYVLKVDTNINNVIKAINFANDNKFSHVRLVEDILKNNSPSFIDDFKVKIKNLVDDKLVIYQGRKIYNQGNKKCLISLLKPNIAPDGNIFGCCGIQYAKNPPSLDFNPNDSMGHINDIKKIWDNQKYYDGSLCKKCYYADYNNTLESIWDSPSKLGKIILSPISDVLNKLDEVLAHKEFI